MPGTVLNTVPSIRAYCYLCFSFVINTVEQTPSEQNSLAQVCRVYGWFTLVLVGLLMSLQAAGKSAVGLSC